MTDVQNLANQFGLSKERFRAALTKTWNWHPNSMSIGKSARNVFPPTIASLKNESHGPADQTSVTDRAVCSFLIRHYDPKMSDMDLS